MGMSSDAKLIYGYDLGDGDGWHIAEYGELPDGEYGFALPWYDNSEEADEFAEQAERRLLAEIAGFTEVWAEGVEGYFARQHEAEKQLGVEFAYYCSHDYTGTLLAAHEISVDWGATEPLDLPALTAQAAAEDWDAKLARAVAALGITPEQEKPGWILCSFYG